MTNWDDLRFFLAIARSGSLSAAARALQVNHTTVARRLSSLEAEHGVALFERHSKGFELSDAGAQILEIAEALEQKHHKISRKLMGLDQRVEGKLHITMPHDLYDEVLAADIAELNRRYPDIELRLSVSKGVRNLANREADIAVRMSPAPPDYLIGKRVSYLRHAIYCHRSFVEPFLSGEFSQRPLPVINWGDEDQLKSWASSLSPKAYVAFSIDDLTSMHAAVQSAVGFARMPVFFPDAVSHPDVVKLPISLPASDWGVWVLNHIDLKATARVKVFRQGLIEALERKKHLFLGLDARA
ncbi:LysR family transcriptional regulator [Agaribacterium haliotis]|uniref:LysR family transcriptional regulator n=1 Tax=Agaribacterium haliotis TaxID=2013869 RepID=UPI0011774069|nr:LysR family transcriptional regulator [Agaribacterium haliotis]